MVYKKYEYPNYNIYAIKDNKFKSCYIEVIFRKNILQHDLIERALLVDTMVHSNKDYPKRKDFVIKCEELYNTTITSAINRLGNSIFTSFCASFINPKFIEEKDYFEEVVKLLMNVIFKPNIKNHEFDLRSFNINKNNLLNEIDTIKENPGKISIIKALKALDETSPSSYGLIDQKAYLEDLTASDLWQIYHDMLKKDVCDIFVIGDLDLENLAITINKYFLNRVIKNTNPSLYLNNKVAKKSKIIVEPGNFVQTNLIMIYNAVDLDFKQRNIIPYVFNNIFGNGTLNSKLFKYLREENSMCYGVSFMYLKYDNLAMIKVSLAKENIPKAIKLIKKALNEMIKGEFTEDNLEDAKKNAIFSINMAQDNQSAVLGNYIFNTIDDFPLPKERIKLVKELTKEDIISFAKKLKLNIIYTLEEGKEI